LGHALLPWKISLPKASASSHLLQLPAAKLLHLIRTARSFDDMPAWVSNTNYHSGNDKYEGKKSSNDRLINLL
jgi:hypothetical protein